MAVRSTPEHDLPLRMMTYLGDVLDHHRKQHTGPLPIVIGALPATSRVRDRGAVRSLLARE